MFTNLLNEWLENGGKLKDGLHHSADSLVALYLFADFLDTRSPTLRTPVHAEQSGTVRTAIDPDCPNCDGTGGSGNDGSCGVCWTWRTSDEWTWHREQLADSSRSKRSAGG